ncbi:MAG TPA: nicotinate-nucleotide adenylyltransferase [Bryobacteraceae bacterium]|nr:nicotinate-nucleotide adenylyltransferase [Bryobacteraceae bacterium]
MRIGLFGGTFDPIHRAHIAVAAAARERFGLDYVLLVPAGNPPHKNHQITASYAHRLCMVQLACAAHEGLIASDLESGAGRSYSINTIERLRLTLAEDDELFFVIGADAFADLHTWYRWREVARLVEFIVVTRPGHRYETPEGVRAHALETIAMNVSSSAIRESLGRGQPPADVPDAVAEYITEKGLYQATPAKQ